jgi:hypothetical protein
MFLLASNARAVEAVKPDRVAVLDADRVVNAPVEAVVAPTVIPLTVPPVRVAPLDASVFSVAVEEAPKVVNEPAAGVTLPIIPCKDVAVATPKVGVTSVGEFDNTTLVVPVLVVTPVPPFATPKVPVMSAVDRLTASQEALVPSV